MKFKLGDRVTWESQSAGSLKIKIGTIVGVILAGCYPFNFPRCGMPRVHESYVVEVKRGKSSKLYWPRVIHLRKVKP